MQQKWISILAGLAILPFAFATGAAAQNPTKDWPMYRGNLEGMGFSPLKQINTHNVDKLTQSWTQQLTTRGTLEATPIAVNGVMYLAGGNAVLAFDGDTGKEIWHYDVQAGPTRGVAYWPGDKDNGPRIIFTTFDRKMIALDAATGMLVPTFGNNGIVEMTVGYDGVPTIYKNLAMVGASVGEVPIGPRGRFARVRCPSPDETVGIFIPSRGPAKWVTRLGSTTAGKAAPASTSGAGI